MPSKLEMRTMRLRAAQGDVISQRELGKHYANTAGYNGERLNISAALRWLGQAASQGDTSAEACMGLVLLKTSATGKRGDRGRAAGEAILRNMADRGVGSAQYMLSDMQAKGRILPKDEAEALRNLSEAAANGHRLAQKAQSAREAHPEQPLSRITDVRSIIGDVPRERDITNPAAVPG